MRLGLERQGKVYFHKESDMRKVKAASVVLDFDLYPRINVDSHNITNLADALKSGAEIPPIVIDKKTRRVADGFHRVKAHLRAFGDDAEIMVIEKSYKTEADLFLDSVRYNACHGAKLDSADRTRCILIAERLHLEVAEMAGILHMPAEKLGALRTGRTAKSGKLEIPIKRTFSHRAGTRFTPEQVKANERSGGMNQKFYVNQLIDILQNDLLDQEDEALLERLEVLHGLLAGMFANT